MLRICDQSLLMCLTQDQTRCAHDGPASASSKEQRKQPEQRKTPYGNSEKGKWRVFLGASFDGALAPGPIRRRCYCDNLRHCRRQWARRVATRLAPTRLTLAQKGVRKICAGACRTDHDLSAGERVRRGIMVI